MGCAEIAGETWPDRPAVLIGREREMRRMTALLGAAEPGRLSVLVVEGPPGSGRRRLLGERPGPDLLELSRVTAGRPGALRDLITGLREEGLLEVTAGRAALHTVRLPGRTVLRLREELAAMSPQARHLLQAATTLRSPFPRIRLTRLLRVSPVSLLPAIDEVLAGCATRPATDQRAAGTVTGRSPWRGRHLAVRISPWRSAGRDLGTESCRDQPICPAATPMALTPQQRERIRQLLEEELRTASRAAIERGATPEEVADLLADRRRALTEHLSEDAGDRPPSSGEDDGRSG